MEETTKNRNKYFTAWCFFLQPWGVDPYLGKSVSYKAKMHHITSFGAMVRTGEVGHGKQIRVGSVRTAITSVAQTIAVDKGKTPLHNDAGDYHLPIKLMLDGFKRQDPPSEKKLAVGIDIPEECCARGLKSKTAKGLAIGDLIIIAFYFLLRIGEYTVKRKKNETKRTVQFRMMDVVFFKKDKHNRLRLLDTDASDEEIMNADGATLRLSDQKNGHKGACIHQEHNKQKYFSPVRAVGRRYCHIRQHTDDPETFISAYFESPGNRRDVNDNDIRRALKIAAIAKDYESLRGIPTNRIDTHSLRAGGANALHLSGYSDREIQKMGRWRSDTFKEYISEQLSSFTKRMSTNMRRRFNFVNVEGGVLRDITKECVNTKNN